MVRGLFLTGRERGNDDGKDERPHEFEADRKEPLVVVVGDDVAVAHGRHGGDAEVIRGNVNGRHVRPAFGVASHKPVDFVGEPVVVAALRRPSRHLHLLLLLLQ